MHKCTFVVYACDFVGTPKAANVLMLVSAPSPNTLKLLKRNSIRGLWITV